MSATIATGYREFQCGCGVKALYLPAMIGGREMFVPRECDRCKEARRSQERLEVERVAKSERQRKWEAGLIVPLAYARTEAEFPTMNRALLEGLLRWRPDGEDRKGIGLWGESGLRKTRMLALVLKKAHMEGWRCNYVLATRLSGAFQVMFGKGDECDQARYVIRKARECDVLLLDDMGKEQFTPHVQSQMFDLIEQRTAGGKRLLWTSNFAGQELARRLDPDKGGPLVRRLEDFCHVYQIEE